MSKMKYTVTPFDGVAEEWKLEVWRSDKPFLAVLIRHGVVRNWNQYKTFDGAKSTLDRWGTDLSLPSDNGYRGAIVKGEVIMDQ